MVDANKNVVVVGMPGVAYSWTNIDNRWANKAWPDELALDMSNTISDYMLHNPYFMFWYKAECTPNASMVVRNLGGAPGLVASQCAHEKFEFLEELAASTNTHVLEILEEVSVLPFQVLSTDYIHDDVIARIIELNENTETGGGRMILAAPAPPTGSTMSPSIDTYSMPSTGTPSELTDIVVDVEPEATSTLKSQEATF